MTAADDFRAALQAQLGGAPEHIEPGRLHRFSLNGKRGDTAGWCKLFDDGRAGVFGDFRTGASGTWTARPREQMTPAERATLARQIEQATRERMAQQRAQWQRNAAILARLWAQAQPVTDGDPVALYLRHRLGCRIEAPQCLRHHPGLDYRHDGELVDRWPAMLGQLTTPTGQVIALHRTWLTPQGRKAPAPGPVKKLTPTAGPMAGACIRLAEPRQGRIGIAEGIETALAACCASGVPTVAAYSAGALAAWQWPASVRRVVVFADADPAGDDAADRLSQRARAAGLIVHVMTPSTPGTDWADVWANRDESEAA